MRSGPVSSMIKLFELIDLEVSEFAIPMALGPTVQGIGYWFRWKG